jgi:hypothetical protein
MAPPGYESGAQTWGFGSVLSWNREFTNRAAASFNAEPLATSDSPAPVNRNSRSRVRLVGTLDVCLVDMSAWSIYCVSP